MDRIYDISFPLLVGAGATVIIRGAFIQGFLCTTTGTITIARTEPGGGSTTLVNALPVTAGQWIDIPMYLGNLGGTITSAAAVGVLMTS